MNGVSHHRLPDTGVLSFRGADALRFLQSQLTADVSQLAAGEARPAAWCSPQGRVLAVLWLIRTADGALALLPRALAADVAEGLRRFVLRSKLAVTDESAVLVVAGIAGDPWPPGVQESGAVVARLPGSRALVVGAPAEVEAACAGTVAGGEEDWAALAIGSGEPEITAATRGEWVPQMLNLDLIGAVSFTKGCYPGQEIVARAHHLGRVKRRMARYSLASGALPAPGDALLANGTRVGEVVRAAGGSPPQALAVVNLEALGHALSDASGTRTLLPAPLPYPLPGAPDPA